MKCANTDCNGVATDDCKVCGDQLCNICWMSYRFKCFDCIERENQELDRLAEEQRLKEQEDE